MKFPITLKSPLEPLEDRTQPLKTVNLIKDTEISVNWRLQSS